MQPGSYRPKFPLHMVWLATNRCNARCLHCSSNSTVKTKDELNEREALDLIDQFVEAGVIDLAISGGEPLMRSDIFTVIAYARRQGLTVGVGSNGWRLTSQQASRLALAGTNRLQISLDGLRSAHDALRNWPGLFDRALSSIRTAQQAGLRVHVCCTINKLNAHELDDFFAFIADSGIPRINLSRYVPTGRGTSALDLDRAEWKRVILRCLELRDQYKGKIEVTTHLAQRVLVDEEVQSLPGFIGCQAGIGQGCVSASGKVFPCVLLPIPVGDLRVGRFREIWRTSPVIRTLQNRDNLKGACGACGQKSRCGGCRALAYAQDGNYLGTDSRCWLGM